jgi:hypothetical protein
MLDMMSKSFLTSSLEGASGAIETVVVCPITPTGKYSRHAQTSDFNLINPPTTGVCFSQLPNQLDRVPLEQRIRRDQRKLLFEALRDENSIEWITVMKSKTFHAQHMVQGYGKYLNSAQGQFRRKKLPHRLR